jgi:cytochrome c-type biogenesis protein CcmH/NrfG
VAEADRQLARAYLTGKKPEQAMAAAQRAIEREPQNPDSLLVRAGLLLSANDPGRTQQAIIEQTQRAMTDAAAAARFALRNIEASPEDEAVQRKLPEYQANCESIIGVVRSQIRQALAGAKLTDLDPALFVGLSQLISLKGDLARKVADYEALSLLKQAAKPEQASIVILLELADRQVALGHAGEAVATAERILKINPANEQAKRIVDSAGKPASK